MAQNLRTQCKTGLVNKSLMQTSTVIWANMKINLYQILAFFKHLLRFGTIVDSKFLFELGCTSLRRDNPFMPTARKKFENRIGKRIIFKVGKTTK